MRRFVLGILALTLALPALAQEAAPKSGGVALSAAQSKQKRSFEAWLKDVKKRIARTRARPNQLVAVAAVRGSEKDVAPNLYWKGKKTGGLVASTELEDFESAIDLALQGQPEATSKLQAFLSSYPKSSLGPDARTALERLTEQNPAP